jgi:DNA-binding transcriptional ArsR family regulator
MREANSFLSPTTVGAPLAEKEEKDRKIEELTERIESLESALREVTRPYAQLVEQLSQFQGVVQRYFRLLDLYQRHGVVAVDVILPEVKDPMSKEIMRILMDRPGLNISQISEELRTRTGSSSRRIVRTRLDKLVEQDLLIEEESAKAHTYRVSERVIKMWSEVLTLSK